MKKTAVILIIISIISLIANEFQAKEHADDELVMAFGDSLTYGKGDRNGEGYIEGLEENLNDPKSGETVRFWNYGIPGQETDGVLKQLDQPEIKTKLEKANTFIVYIGTNDLINSNGGKLDHVDSHKIRKEKKEYLAHLQRILSILMDENQKADILVIGLYNPEKSKPELEKLVEEYNQSVRKILSKNDRLIFIPTNDLFNHKKKEEYFSDGLHPNEKGYQLITNRILEQYDFK